jgi:hypothetical protein
MKNTHKLTNTHLSRCKPYLSMEREVKAFKALRIVMS